MELYRQILLNNFVVKAQTFQTFISPYLTLLVYLQLWFSVKIPKSKREEAGSFSKNKRQKLQRLYTHGGAAFGSVRNLVKASNLPVSKMRQFLHSKPSNAKSALARRKFKRMKAFDRFKNEVFRTNLA